MGRPVLCVVGGHNGAGGTKLHEEVLAHRTAAPFVNADRLALERFGHPAVTEEAQLGRPRRTGCGTRCWRGAGAS